MLKIEHISKAYKKRLILDDISYQFDNRIYALVGENGRKGKDRICAAEFWDVL